MTHFFWNKKIIYIELVNIYRFLLFALFLFHMKWLFDVFKFIDQNREKGGSVTTQSWQNYLISAVLHVSALHI